MNLDPLQRVTVVNLNLHRIHINFTDQHNLPLCVTHLITDFTHPLEPQNMLTVLWVKLTQKL
jgi:hypothetical protein